MNGSGQVSRGLQILIAIVIVVASLRFAEDVLIPLALATLMTFLLAPLVARLQRIVQKISVPDAEKSAEPQQLQPTGSDAARLRRS